MVFWIGFGVGAIVGGSVVFTIMTICTGARRGGKK